MMNGIVIVGAGSMVFTRTLISDLARDPANRGEVVRLVDSDPERLELAGALCRQIVGELNAEITVECHGDRRSAFEGVRFIIVTIKVGGREAIDIDFAIPAKYGIVQTVGDTLGIGGIMRGWRTIPAIVDILRDAEAYAPGAMVLNYTNPMTMICMAADRSSNSEVFGLCHSIPNTARQVAGYLGVDEDSLEWETAGINHMAWMTRLSQAGQDLYPALRENSMDDQIYNQDPVRFELLKHVGYFVTESSKHNAEYTGFFMNHPDEVERLNVPLKDNSEKLDRLAKEYTALRSRIKVGESLARRASGEYAPMVIGAVTAHRDVWFYASVPNRGLIPNLPTDAAVEVPCFISNGRVFPTGVDPLPSFAAALNRQAIEVQRLAVEATLEKSVRKLSQAAMLDPQVSAKVKLRDVVRMVGELVAAHERAQ